MRREELGIVVAEFKPQMERENPRNSEGAFLNLKDGRILFVYSRFKGRGQEDWAPADICAVVSSDGGQSFGDGRILLSCEEEIGRAHV